MAAEELPGFVPRILRADDVSRYEQTRPSSTQCLMAGELRWMEPERIILIKADVFRVAYPALAAAGLPVSQMRIPFPSSGRQKEFAVAFSQALAGE